MNWSPTSTIAWNHGRKVLKFIDESNRCYVRDEDIIVQMKSRATQGYGLKVYYFWGLFQNLGLSELKIGGNF